MRVLGVVVAVSVLGIAWVFALPAAYVGTFGLGLDIVGAFLIWRYGLPPDVRPDGTEYVVTGGYDQEERARGRRFDRLSHLGMYLLVLGFALQAESGFLPDA